LNVFDDQLTRQETLQATQNELYQKQEELFQKQEQLIIGSNSSPSAASSYRRKNDRAYKAVAPPDSYESLPISNSNGGDVRKGIKQKTNENREGGISDDVLFFHDSLGHKINDTMLRKFSLKVRKVEAYTWDQAIPLVKKELQRTKPRVIIFNIGTNDIKKNAEGNSILKKVGDIVEYIGYTSPETQVVISEIVRRHDFMQRVKYVNEGWNKEYQFNKYVHISKHFRINEEDLTDGVHLTKIGTSKLARNLRDTTVYALGLRAPRL
jgi:lysophospholipase L1-like esterase